MGFIEVKPIPKKIQGLSLRQRREINVLGRKNRQIGSRTVVVFPGDNIQDAIDELNDDNGGIVLLKSGNHVVDRNLNIYSHIKIIGDNLTSILDFNSQSFSIIATGTSIYSTGTITAITSGVNVTGSGTSWSSNVTAGQHLFIGTRWYKIASVTSDTALVLSEGYVDNVTLPSSYRIVSVIEDIQLRNLTLKDSSNTAFKPTDIRKLVLDNLTFLDNNKGIVITNASETSVERIQVISSTDNGIELTNVGLSDWESINPISNGGHGIVLNNVKAFTLNPSSCTSNTGDGMNITTGVDLIILGEFNGNGGQGIEGVSGNDNITIFNSIIRDNTSDGLKLTATSDNCSVLNCNFKDNGGFGWNVAASTCDDNYFIKNRFSGNTSGKFSDSGTNTFIDEELEFTLSKSSDETVNNSSTLQSDDDFTFSVDANTNYLIDIYFFINTSGTADFKWDWSLPSGGTFDGRELGPQTRNIDVTEAGDLIAAYSAGDNNVLIQGVLKIGSTAGTVVIRWAQATAEVSDTKLQAGSWLKHKILS